MVFIYENYIEDVFESINGEPLKVQILKFTSGLDIKIKTKWKRKVKWKGGQLLLMVALTIVAALNNLENIYFYWVLFIFTIGLFFSITNTVIHEKLLVIKSLGYQIETKYVFGESTTFVPWESIDDVFINEVISLQRVLFVLSIFTKGKNKLIPLFTVTKPRVKCLRAIYRSLKLL